jgi:hypothetical protein
MLSNDICRCHDRHCPRNETCWRYINRRDKGDHLTHCMSLMDAGTKVCNYYVEDTNDQKTSQRQKV